MCLVYSTLYIKRVKLNLLSHAEGAEDVVEDVFGGDFAKVVEALAEVFADEVGGGVGGKGLLGTLKGFERLL